MKLSTTVFLTLFSIVISSAVYAEEKPSGNILLLAQAEKTLGDIAEEKPAEKAPAEPQDKKDEGFKGSILTGASTIGGKNYQQIGLRTEFPIGKLGIGLDILIQIDENGKIRQEDWIKPIDYLDKIYYVRWGHKGDPFYIRAGGLDFTYMGYGSSIYGYSNMVEYPTYKRTGMEMSFVTEKIGGEFIFNNFKELMNNQPSMVVGGRLFYKFFPRFSVGVSYAGDLNARNGLRDFDGDNYPDEIDMFPNDKRLVTEIDRFRQKLLPTIGSSATETTIANLVAAGLIDSTETSTLPEFYNQRQMINIIGADAGFSIFDREGLKWDIYTQVASIMENKSWGFSAPGTRLMIGNFRFTADFRMTSDEFIFGFFNNTYELERASIDKTGGQLRVMTKLDQLKEIEAKKGFFASIDYNIMDTVLLKAGYQDLIDGSVHDRSINSELIYKNKYVPLIDQIKGYYIRNDFGKELDWYFDGFTEFRTPGTIMGYMVDIKIGEGVIIKCDYKYTFEDKDGNGNINGSDETLQTISISTTSAF